MALLRKGLRSSKSNDLQRFLLVDRLPSVPGLPARPYQIEEYTRTVCPRCVAEGRVVSTDDTAFVDGMLISHDGKIWMRRWCPRHGATESLYEESAEVWRKRFGWATPTLTVTPDRLGNFAGFPAGYREGLPSSHGQHTCILLLNLTERCNLSCPTCYAAAVGTETPVDMESPTIDEIEHTVDTMLAREEGRLSVLMLSGGEPTIRRDLDKIIERLIEKPITRIMLNTNGRRIDRDEAFVKFLQKHRQRIEVYLQFDGLTEEPYLHLRGEPLVEEKKRILAKLQAAGIWTTLVMTVKQGINEDQVGDVIQLGLDTPRCAGVAIQPVFGSGRESGIDPMNRVTPTGVLSRLETQTGGRLGADDFIPLPCSHRDCCDIGYLLNVPNKGWTSLTQLVGRNELSKWIHLVSNTIAFENTSDMVRQLVKSGVLQRVFSEQQKVSALELARDLLTLCDCIPGLRALLTPGGTQESLEKLAEKTFRVTVKQFMDAHTFHEHRIRQCCVHVGTYEEDPRRHSFCWRWLFPDVSDFPGRNDRGLTRIPML